MNDIYNYYEAFNKLSNGEGLFPKYMELSKELTPVISYKDNPQIKKEVEEFLKFYTPKKKECFTNAFFLSHSNSNFDYILGMYSHIIPLEHAWSYHKPTGLFIDLTAELLLDSKHIYSAQYRIPSNKLRYITMELNGNVPPAVFDLHCLGLAEDYLQ